jgi:hypothetical protein
LGSGIHDAYKICQPSAAGRREPRHILQAVDEWLAPYRLLSSARLDDLERHLGAMPDASP